MGRRPSRRPAFHSILYKGYAGIYRNIYGDVYAGIWGWIGIRVYGLGFRDITPAPVMEGHMEVNMESELESGVLV